MSRKIEIWDVCSAKRHTSALVLEKVLAKANPFVTDTTYTEILFSTTDWSDIERLKEPCCSNIMLAGATEQVLYDVTIVSKVVSSDNGKYIFTISAEVWL